MRVPIPDNLLPADQLGTVHFIGAGPGGLGRDAQDTAGRIVQLGDPELAIERDHGGIVERRG